MGQYYRPALIDDLGHVSWLSCYRYNNGAKLMEHSYVGNTFVDAVLSMIWKNPMKIAWIGDYSDSPFSDAYSEKIDEEKFSIIYRLVWEDEEDIHLLSPEITNKLSMRMKKRFLVNHTLKRYIDLGKYIAENKWVETYTYGGKKRNSVWAINPLPLLTACGNDRGGGDFHYGNTGYKLVGTWAFDLIEYTDKKPDYEEQVVHFMEDAA